MGRHRNDPRGHSRYVIAVGAVVLLLALIGLGVYALHGALSEKPTQPAGAAEQRTQPLVL